MRAIMDALPQYLFMMIAVTPDALRRYSLALPAFRSRLQEQIELGPLTNVDEALNLAKFYIETAANRAQQEKKATAPDAKQILDDAEMKTIFQERLKSAAERGDQGVRHREFLHDLHTRAESLIYAV